MQCTFPKAAAVGSRASENAAEGIHHRELVENPVAVRDVAKAALGNGRVGAAEEEATRRKEESPALPPIFHCSFSSFSVKPCNRSLVVHPFRARLFPRGGGDR